MNPRPQPNDEALAQAAHQDTLQADEQALAAAVHQAPALATDPAPPQFSVSSRPKPEWMPETREPVSKGEARGIEAAHSLPATEVLAALESRMDGLDSRQIRQRLEAHGPNRLRDAEGRAAWTIFVDQFRGLLIAILLLAALIAGILGEVGDALSILVILTLNAVLGFFQEYRAEQAMEAIKRLASPQAIVLREGVRQQVPGSELVPGDLCYLEAGMVVPADLRLLEAASLRIDEAALTGESVPVDKNPAPVELAAALGDRRSMAYASTQITNGTGLGVITATGMRTEVGKIAGLLQETATVRTPLQRRLDAFGRTIGAGALAICAVLFLLGLSQGEPALQMLLVSISLAVAAVPEALPAVVTIALALGARRMAAQSALARRLSAVETLGSVTVIATDKTGTLTQNTMQVEAIESETAEDLLRAAVLCNNAQLSKTGQKLGDPTEIALLEAGKRLGLLQTELLLQEPKLAELPFDSDRKRMTTLHRSGETIGVHAKGATEGLLDCCTAYQTTEGVRPLSQPIRNRIRRQEEEMAGQGLRVLGFATKSLERMPLLLEPEAVERDLVWLGLVGLMDPPRPDAAEAVAECHNAGIRPLMITGDHPLTAQAIGQRLGIWRPGQSVLTGRDLETLSPEALSQALEHTSVFARVTPEHKLQIVRGLQSRGELVAMTGDGVNDAPALKRAEIGVAMGITGTDVAKDAAGIILLDDRFSTIVQAVREGRRIYDNLRRFVRYILTTNTAEIAVMLLAPLLGFPVPLLPIQILWINLVTDGLPALALAVEPAERDVMSRPPRPPAESLFAHGLGFHVVFFGLLLAGLSLLALEIGWLESADHHDAQTMVFTVLAFGQLAHCLAIRSEKDSLFRQGLFGNLPLLGAIGTIAALQLAALYFPPLRTFLHTRPLAWVDLALCIGLSALVFVGVELEKAWRRRDARSKVPA